MKFTYGICTRGPIIETSKIVTQPDKIVNFVPEIIKRIEKFIPDCQIIVVGGPIIKDPNVFYIPFDDDRIKGGTWITKKKNIITQCADNDIIVYTHDYIAPNEDFYPGFCKFGTDWDICMVKNLQSDGKRYTDWKAWDDPIFGDRKLARYKDLHWFDKNKYITYNGESAIVPDAYDRTRYMAIFGHFWIAKKHVMIEEPLNEEVFYNEGEDIEWSLRVRHKYKYMLNTESSVVLLKDKRLNDPKRKYTKYGRYKNQKFHWEE